MTNLAAAAKIYVRFVMDELKLSPSGLAKLAKLAPTTLTRALNDPDHKFILSTSTIDKIAKASGINPAPFMEARDFVQASMAPIERADVYDETWQDPPRDESDHDHSFMIIGEAAVGSWKDPRLAAHNMGLVLLSSPGAHQWDLFSLIVEDNSVNKYLQKGQYALCLRTTAKRFRAEHGSLVAVERRTQEGLMEISIRRLLIPTKGTPYLRLDSDREEFLEILSLSADFMNDPKVKIIGEVIYGATSIVDWELAEQLGRRNRAARGIPELPDA
jgi:hypothetical protein